MPSPREKSGSPAGFDPSKMSLCVLASGSAGNCTVLVHPTADGPRLTLIDLGLSPRRTRRLLADLGLSLEQVDEIVLTHFDSDHFNASWRRLLPGEIRLHAHRRHLGRATYVGAPARPMIPFDGPFELASGAVVRPALLQHDRLGVATFRIETEQGSIGFATDVGRVSERLVGLLEGVDVLAIESNYCPKLQHASSRPAHLKRRIMGGSGHLSNEQCVDATRAIGPREHVVLLHLSRQCNHPDLAAAHHAGAEYGLTVTSQIRPTPWIRVRGGAAGGRRVGREVERKVVGPSAAPVPAQLPLFGP